MWLECDMDKFEAKCIVCVKAFDMYQTWENQQWKAVKRERSIFILWKHNISFEDPEVEAYRQRTAVKKVDVGFVAQQMLKEKCEKFVWKASSSIQNGMWRFSCKNSF